MGETPDRGNRGTSRLIELPPPLRRPQSFAEVVAVLERLNHLEAAIAGAIATSRVPPSEVRLLLRAEDPAPASNAPAFQFMRQIFAQVGLPLTVEAVGRFSFTFIVEDTQYARLFARDHPGRTCAFVSEALSRFLEADFGIPAEVEESACRNAGDVTCRFAASLDPLAVRFTVLDATDWSILRGLGTENDLAESLLLSQDEFDYRMERLVGYGLASASGRRKKDGDALLARGPPPEDFKPPWRAASELAEAIADAQSFAEAVIQVAPARPGEPTADAETAALAAGCRSFAELLARASQRRSEE